MKLYRITASSTVLYEFDIEAEGEQEALTEFSRIQLSQDIEEYAYDWSALEVTDIEEEEAE